MLIAPGSTRGRLRETFRGWSRVRRLLLPLVTAAPGGLGSPSVPTKGDCLEWLDAARMKGGESCPDRGREYRPFRPRKRGHGDRNRRDGAPRGARAPDNGARQDGRLVRRLALHPPRHFA